MEQTKNKNFGLILAVYLLGIFMGALDTGIVTPARTIIQNNLSVDEKTGIWMITIYTLAYAASIPIMGKLADKYGRKYIYLTSIFLFGIGSMFCGLAQNMDSFTVLLIARAVQAIGGGGILPVATAEFGTTFPREKRGMALGLVGGVFGIANIFGASAGSAILDLFGKNNWQYIFYIHIPITLFILIAGFLTLPNTKEKNVKPIDFAGISILTVMVLSLLYGLKNVDFFSLGTSVMSSAVLPFLLIFIFLLPIFIQVEKKAQDPVINLKYFKNANIVITLVLSFVIGVAMMGMIFVPQFSENALKIASGSGGYFVLVLAVFAGVGAPLSGRLIDLFGVKIVLGFGFIANIAGALYLVLITTNYPTFFHVIVSLILIGLGMGFTIGTPLNYMMLENTRKEESNSALATLSLIRSIGTAIAPAIMIGFIAHAGIGIQSNVMELLPTEISVPPLPYAQELTDEFAKLKSDPATSEQFSKFTMPDLTSMQTVQINMNGNGDYMMPNDLVDLMKTSDVTNITQNTKILADRMFMEMTPDVIIKITSGIDNGISGLSKGIESLDQKIIEMEKMPIGAGPGPAVIAQMKTSKIQMSETLQKMTALRDAVPSSFEQAKANYLREIDNTSPEIEKAFQTTLNKGFKQVYLTVFAASVIAILLLIFYRDDYKVRKK
ncbi:MFS transporter [Parasporobacterium paucivorans]|uniref:Drug resistance transporter, EmrB/QacA subfamily n=1 Tax=Parasporobacterium paucivorans DSM 15970 TaxID=1122934 RepID=A0A1M6IPZ2_9FIRM|nr:MFS transporter [Parasporobacterium paucivorans]SHJ36536.1 drug resistance transporter, EmrB/QacA subfamily [Parasporobacterium paucivorans DSM 15970]